MLWERLKDQYGEKPHPLPHLIIRLGEGVVSLRYMTSRATVITQTLKSPMRGGGTAIVTGSARGPDEAVVHVGACFCLGSTRTMKIFVARDAQIMNDFINARAALRSEKIRLGGEWEKSRAEAVNQLPGVLAEIDKNMGTLSRSNFIEEAPVRDRGLKIVEDKLTALNRRRVDMEGLIASTVPPSPDESLGRAVHFAPVECLSLSRITDAIKIERRRLLAEFGTLPLKPSVIPVSNVVHAVVRWNRD